MKARKEFFDKKNLLVICGVVFLVYLLTWGVVLVQNKMEHDRGIRAQQTELARIQNLSKEEKAIRKTEDYLRGSIALVDTSERIFFSYLQRKFDLDEVIGAQGPPIDLYKDPRTYPEQVHFLARIAYPDQVVTQNPPKSELDDNIKITNIYSANCDHLDLPDDFWQTMGDSMKKGSYYMTHVALALELMEDNKCPMPPIAADMQDKATQEMVRLAEDKTTIADLRYESIAFLMLQGRRDLVKKEWIQQIITEQKEDGGWSQKVGEGKNDFHSTLLAFWSLLEYSRSETPYEPLIPRPTPKP